MELDMKIKFYNNSHSKEANKIIMGWKVEEYLKKMISSSCGNIDIYNAELQWNNDIEEYELSKFKDMYVEINRAIPYVIDVEYSEVYDVINSKDKIIDRLFFSKEEVRKINRMSNYKVKEDMDNSLKDLKSWIEYDKYLKSIGEQEDNL